MTGYPTAPPKISSDGPGAVRVPTINPGRIFGIDYAASPDQCFLTIWLDGRIIDSGPIEDFDENGNRRRP